jgi:ankyrin repeat protein
MMQTTSTASGPLGLEELNIRFFDAAYHGRAKDVRSYLKLGADIEAKFRNFHSANEGKTALNCACLQGHSDVTRLLLERGANVDAKDEFGRTGLILATWNSHLECVRLVLDHGADIEAKDNSGLSALGVASSRESADLCRYLLDRGARINARDGRRFKPIHHAIRNCHADTMRVFLERGESPYGRFPNGMIYDEILERDPECLAVLLAHRNGKVIESVIKSSWPGADESGQR